MGLFDKRSKEEKILAKSEKQIRKAEEEVVQKALKKGVKIQTSAELSKELNKISAELNDIKPKYEQQIEEIDKLTEENKQFKSLITPEILDYNNCLKLLATAQERLASLNLQVSEQEIILSKINIEIAEKRILSSSLDDELSLQDFGMYKPVYDFANSEQYKDRLAIIKQQQKDSISNDTAVTYPESFTFNGSLSQGKSLVRDNVKQILRSFNNECDVLIDKAKFNTVEAIRTKIMSSFESLNKMNAKMNISISHSYLALKLDELNLAYEYSLKKQEEKDRIREEKELLREEAKLQKELEEARKTIDKEKNHYSNALATVIQQLANDPDNIDLLNKKIEIESQLVEIDKNLKDIDYREANKRAGYVYIISNIGAFGENVYKIGMTRRLEPQERVDELGDASVPFRFDVHAMIFSDDAPALENALHNAFESKKMNMINHRREFFNVTLDEIKEVVKKNFDKTVEFKDIPEAEQYRESLKLKETV